MTNLEDLKKEDVHGMNRQQLDDSADRLYRAVNGEVPFSDLERKTEKEVEAEAESDEEVFYEARISFLRLLEEYFGILIDPYIDRASTPEKKASRILSKQLCNSLYQFDFHGRNVAQMKEEVIGAMVQLVKEEVAKEKDLGKKAALRENLKFASAIFLFSADKIYNHQDGE